MATTPAHRTPAARARPKARGSAARRTRRRAAVAEPSAVHLDPSQILGLQLYARGYSAAQIAPLVNQSPSGVSTLLALAAAHLGTTDVPGAIAEARRRALIV